MQTFFGCKQERILLQSLVSNKSTIQSIQSANTSQTFNFFHNLRSNGNAAQIFSSNNNQNKNK